MRKVLAFLIFAGLCTVIFLSQPVSSKGKKGIGTEGAKLRRNANKIENSYIVVLDDTVVGEKGIFSIAPYIASELATSHRGKIKHVYQHALNGFAVEMSAEDAERLSQDFRVKFVEEDGTVTADATQTNPPWGLDRIDQRTCRSLATYTYTRNGSGIRAYIIDTGIQTGHPQFGGRAAVSRPRCLRWEWTGLQRTRHPRRRHRWRRDLRGRQGVSTPRRARAQLQRLGLDLGRDRGGELGPPQPH